MKDPGYSLERRLSIQLARPMIVGLALLCVAIQAATTISFSHKQNVQLEAALATTTASATLAERNGGLSEMRRRLQDTLAQRAGTYLELRKASGDVVYRDSEPLRDPAQTRQRDFKLALTLGEVHGELLLDTTYDRRMLGRLAMILTGALLLGSVSIWFSSRWRARRTMQPLLELTNQIRAVTPDRMDQRLSLTEPVAELQPWIDQFNAMLRRMESAYVQLEAFNADVAHELRTPLAALMGHTEVALSREDRTVASLRETMTGNLEELQRLSSLVNDMLFLSRADRGATARYGEPASLAALVCQVVNFHEAALSDAQLHVSVEGDVEMAVDAPLFKRAVSNLLGNATRYAEQGSLITVRVGVDLQGRVEISVENEGPEIAASHIPRLFDRFYRIDESRVDGHLHHGLGLAIVAAIARMHEGSTLATSGGGSTRIGFSVRRSGI